MGFLRPFGPPMNIAVRSVAIHLSDMIKRSTRPNGFVEPCIPSPASVPPSGTGWAHEIKHDGYRLIVRRDATCVRLFTRRGYDWTARFPVIADAAGKLRARTFTLDGEAVVCGPDGVAVFNALHTDRRLGEAFLYAFDLIEVDGEDFRLQPLSERKTRLARLLTGSIGIALNEHIEAEGAPMFAAVCRMGLEGIVSKRINAIRRDAHATGSRPRTPTVRRCGGWAKGGGDFSPQIGRLLERTLSHGNGNL